MSLTIAQLVPFCKNINLTCIIIEEYQGNLLGNKNNQSNATSSFSTKDGHKVYDFLVADNTGSIVASFWDEKGAYLRKGDIIRITDGHTSLFKGALHLYLSKNGTIARTGEFCLTFSEHPNVSQFLWKLDPTDPEKKRLVIATSENK